MTRPVTAAASLLLAAAWASADEAPRADVLAATVSGAPGAYRLTVTDWWEVLTPEGDLVYRRILHHSHVGEQPFTRAGGPVAVGPERTLLIRAHMHPTGYGGRVLRGTPAAGFTAWPEAPRDLAPDLDAREPQPAGCRF